MQSVSATWTSIMSGEHWFESKLSIFSNNLVDPDGISVYGHYIDARDGTVIDYAGYRHTDYSPVVPGHVYYIGAVLNNAANAGLAWYDSAKVYISGLGNSALRGMNKIATAPTGAAYCRFSFDTSNNPQYVNTVFLREFGENLFDASTVSEAGYYINPSNGNVTSGSTQYRCSDFIEVVPATTYYFGMRNLSGNAGYAWYNESKIYVSGDTLTNLSSGGKTLVSPANAKYLRWTINVSVNTDWDKMSYVSTGFVNLFDKTTVADENKYIYYNDGNPSVPPSGETWHYSDYIAVTPFTTYFVGISLASSSNRAAIAWYDSNKTFLTYLTTQRQIELNRIVNAPENAAYARFSFRTDVGYDQDWEHTVFFTEYAKNLLDVETMSESGKYIDSRNGGVGNSGQAYRYSDYIRVIPGVSYRISMPAGTSNTAGLAWYNSNKSYLSGEGNYVTTKNRFVTTAPENAAYVRFSLLTTSYPYNNTNYKDHAYFTVDRGIPDIVPQYYTYDETKIHSISTSNGLFGDNPTIGGCGCGELSFSVTYNNETPARMARCVPYVRCKNSTPLTSEWIKKGEYFIDERSMTKYQGGYQTMNVHAYDAMLKAEASYPSSTTAWPASDISVVTEIANTIGVLVDARTTTLLNKAYQISLPASRSMRECLSYIGSMYGANTIISDAGQLLMIPLSGGSDSHSLGDGVMQLDYGTDQPPYTKVTYIVDEETQASAGSGEDKVLEVDNPWGTAAIATACLQSLSSFRYQPFTASGCIIDPAFEIGDAVTINGITSHIYTASTEFGRLMLASLSAPLTVDVDHEYKYISPAERKYRRELGDMASSITLNSQQIQLKVNAGDIISTINQSAEAVTINADKINLVGNVAVGNNASSAILTIKYNDYIVEISPRFMWMAFGDGRFMSMSGSYIGFGLADDYTTDPFSGFCPHYETVPFLRITSTSGWNVHSGSISGPVVFTAQPGTEYECWGKDPNNSSVYVISNGTSTKYYISEQAGRVFYRLRTNDLGIPIDA